MGAKFVDVNRDTVRLLPPDTREWAPKGLPHVEKQESGSVCLYDRCWGNLQRESPPGTVPRKVRYFQSMCIRPSWTAFLMAAIREATPSFASRFATCVFTVPSEMKS